MGLSIHYSGKIKDYLLIDELINEVEDICKSFNWKYNIFSPRVFNPNTLNALDSDFIDYKLEDLKGISFSPDECEPVILTFFPSGILCSFIKLVYNNPVTNDLIVQVVHTKTQFAGPDVHMAVLNLLQYLKDKYFSVFELSDEGDYWETKDKAILLSQFSKYNFMLKAFTDAMNDFEAVPGETVTSLADRLEQFLKNKLDLGKKE